jgi:hypothetical protein
VHGSGVSTIPIQQKYTSDPMSNQRTDHVYENVNERLRAQRECSAESSVICGDAVRDDGCHEATFAPAGVQSHRLDIHGICSQGEMMTVLFDRSGRYDRHLGI